LVQPTSPPDSPLFVNMPELDQRLVVVEPKTGQVKQTLFPDAWSAEMGQVLDFAVSRKGLMFVLLTNRRAVDDPRLYVVDLRDGALKQALALSPWPQNLTWDCQGRLWVGHSTQASGPAGLLSVVDVERLAVKHRVSLEGSAVAVVPMGTRRGLVVERAVWEDRDDDVVVASSLAEVDLEAGKVTRRRRLPPGAAQAAVGPSGHLYIGHASGPGTLATDGTVSVVSRRSLRTLRRLRLGMIVRRMVATRVHLVLNMLSGTGDVWIAVMTADDSTLFDFRTPALVAPDLSLVGDMIYIPLKRGQVFQRVSLKRQGRPHLKLKGAGDSARLGLVRTWMECDGD